MAVLRAVVSTPSVPALVIRHDPSRQPSADVVVVAGAAGALPVGLVAGVGDWLGGSEDSLAVGDSLASDGDSVVGGTVVADAVDPVEAPPPPIWPQTAPAMSPTTAVRAIATATMAAAGIWRREPSGRCAIPSA